MVNISAAGSLSCCGYSCEQSFSMDLSSKPQPSSSWGFSLRSGLQGGFWDKIRGVVGGKRKPFSDQSEYEPASAKRVVVPPLRNKQINTHRYREPIHKDLQKLSGMYIINTRDRAATTRPYGPRRQNSSALAEQ